MPSAHSYHLGEFPLPFVVENVFADDVAPVVFDVVNPETGLGWHSGQTLEKLKHYYPTARMMSFNEWLEKRGLKREDYS